MKDKEKANCHTCVHEDICQLRTFSYCEEEVKEKGCKHYQPKLPENARVFIPTDDKYILLSREEICELKCQAEEDFNKAYDLGSKETAKKILNELVGHTFEDDGWTWTVSKEDIQWLADKYKVEIKE